MNYSLNLITTSAHCNELVGSATLLMDELEFRKHQRSRNYRALVENRKKLNNEVRDINTDMKRIKQILSGTDDKAEKDDFESRLIKLRHKKFLIEEKISRCDVCTILLKELEISFIEKQKAEVELFINTVKKLS